MNYIPSFKEIDPSRKFDAGLFVFYGNTGDAYEENVTAGGGSAVTGVAKLAQRVLLRLMTPAGSYTYEPLEGTTFADDIVNSRLYTATDITRAVSTAVDSVIDLFAKEAELDPSIPLDEQLNDLVIDDVQVTSDLAKIHLTLITNASSSYQFIAPIRLKP